MGAARRRRSSRGARLRWGIGAAVAVLAATAGYALYTHQKARNTQRLLHDAQAYQEQEDWANAAIAYRQYLRRRPDDRDALPAYGDVLYRQLDASPQSAADAVGVFRKLLDADPSNIEAISKLASIWLAFGRFSEAEDLSRRWVELAPQSLEAAMARARALYGRGKHEEAVDALQQALLRMPKEGRLFPPLIRLLAVELQKPEEALTWADRAIQAAPELAEVQMAVFALHQQRGDYDTAERHLLRAMELAPESADTITAGGAFFTSRGELDRAADVFERGAKLFPADHRLLVARRVWAIRKNDPSEMARVAADLTAYAAANDPSLLAQAADLLLRARHDDGLNECIAALHAASEANEELAGWHHALKGMRALLNHRPTTAVIHLDDAERLLPASAAIKTLLARAFAEVGALNSAASVYRQVITMSGDKSSTRLALAKLELARGRFAAARDAIRNIPETSRAEHAHQIGFINTACDLLESSQRQRSEATIESLRTDLVRQALAAPPDDALVAPAAECLMACGQRRHAVDLLRTALPSSSDAVRLGAKLGRILLGRNVREAGPPDADLHAAGALADELIARFPASAEGYTLRTRVLALTHGLSHAARFVDESAVPDAAKARLWEALADEYRTAGDGQHMVEALRKALALLPEDLAVRQRLAEVTPNQEEGLTSAHEMRIIEGEPGLYWRYTRAGVLIRTDSTKEALAEAVTLLEGCLVQRPYWVGALVLLGDAHYRAGRLERAADSYRAAIAQQEALATGTIGLKLVHTLKQLDRLTEAEAVLAKLTNAHPDNPEVLRLETERHYRNREMEAAATTAERLMKIQPDDPSWGALTADLHRHAGNPARAEQIARNVLHSNPDATPALWSLAQTLIAQQRFEEVEAMVQDCATEYEDTRRRLLCARILARLGQDEQARALLEQTTQAALDDARVWTAAADIAHMLGDRARQLAFTRRAITVRGEDPGESLALAQLLISMGGDAECSEADAIIRRRLTKDQEDAKALILQGRLAMLRDPPDLHQAETSWRQALASDPRSTQAHRLLTSVQLRLGRAEEAYDTVSAGLAIAPHDPGLLLASATTLIAMEDSARAFVPLKHLLNLTPRTPEGLELLASASINCGKVDEAISFLEAQAPKEARSALEVGILAKLEEAKGNLDRAEMLFRRAQDMDETSPRIHRNLLRFLARRRQFEDVHTLAIKRRTQHADDIESLIEAAEILGSQSDQPRLRDAGLVWLEEVARDHAAYAARAMYRCALCYYALGQMEHAESRLLESLRLAPNEPAVVNDLAWIYSEHLGQPEKALALIEGFTAAGGRPDAHMLDTHGVALVRLNRFDDAKPKFAACLRVAGKTPTRTAAAFHLGRLFLRTGQQDEGMAHIREALRLDELRGGLSPAEREEGRRLTESAGTSIGLSGAGEGR